MVERSRRTTGHERHHHDTDDADDRGARRRRSAVRRRGEREAPGHRRRDGERRRRRPGAEPGTIPYLSHGIGVDESLWSGEPQTQLSGVHAALQRDRSETTSSVVEPGTIPYLSHGIGVDASQFSGRPSLGLTGDSPLTRVSAPEPEGLTGDSAATRYPRTVAHDGDVRRQRRRLDVLRGRGRRGGTARRRDRGRLPDDAAPRRGCTPVDRPTREPERGDFGGIAPFRWTRRASRAAGRAPRAGEEAGLDEERQGVALDDRPAVEALDREPPPAIGPDPARRARRAPGGATRDPGRAAAAASGRRARRRAPPRRRGGRRARRPRARRARPHASATEGRRRTAVPGRRRRARARSSSSASRSSRSRSTAPGERELRAAEPLDEVAAAAGADGLERRQLPVDGAVPARDPLGADAVTRHDPLPLEQELRERAPVAGHA